MHDDRLRPGLDRRPCDLDMVARRLVPSEPNLDGDRDLHRAAHGLDDAGDAPGLARERGAEPLAREVVDGAAEVHVDEIRATRLGECRGPRHLLRVRARELHRERGLIGRATNQRELRPAFLLEAAGDHHLGHEDARAVLDAEAAEGQVRALRHGSDDDGARRSAGKLTSSTMEV